MGYSRDQIVDMYRTRMRSLTTSIQRDQDEQEAIAYNNAMEKRQKDQEFYAKMQLGLGLVGMAKGWHESMIDRKAGETYGDPLDLGELGIEPKKYEFKEGFHPFKPLKKTEHFKQFQLKGSNKEILDKIEAGIEKGDYTQEQFDQAKIDAENNPDKFSADYQAGSYASSDVDIVPDAKVVEAKSESIVPDAKIDDVSGYPDTGYSAEAPGEIIKGDLSTYPTQIGEQGQNYAVSPDTGEPIASRVQFPKEETDWENYSRRNLAVEEKYGDSPLLQSEEDYNRWTSREMDVSSEENYALMKELEDKQVSFARPDQIEAIGEDTLIPQEQLYIDPATEAGKEFHKIPDAKDTSELDKALKDLESLKTGDLPAGGELTASAGMSDTYTPEGDVLGAPKDIKIPDAKPLDTIKEGFGKVAGGVGTLQDIQTLTAGGGGLESGVRKAKIASDLGAKAIAAKGGEKALEEGAGKALSKAGKFLGAGLGIFTGLRSAFDEDATDVQRVGGGMQAIGSGLLASGIGAPIGALLTGLGSIMNLFGGGGRKAPAPIPVSQRRKISSDLGKYYRARGQRRGIY